MKRRNHDTTYTGWRPKYSDSGASSTGPMAYPKTYNERHRVVTSDETPNSSWMPVAPEEMPPAHQVLGFRRAVRKRPVQIEGVKAIQLT
jgi:hypothetical protein